MSNNVCPDCNGEGFVPENKFDPTEDEPEPSGQGVDIADVVQADIEARAELGEEKYGERLTSSNGRDPLIDLYQEILDAAMYIRQLIQERYD